ncbi:hypothetical protein EPA93_09840 [Ktedonosporobacter rubrisoli]|uniref:Uncharacterized protein n=1 Tax=Ktedonosporobacter rubrisoli TaxID=2509675 RepID=A0A4P6JMN8_KTERU|nr:hypothetical protein [Ktedonosporobacter rubrisoli]QBD76292.1 hypothetical protein EPA93_09840 [Ktedonosporobacter rubrisoli]
MNAAYKLPTSRAIAEEAFAEFMALREQFPPQAKQLLMGLATKGPQRLFKFIEVRRCVSGISPEIAFEEHVLEVFLEEAAPQLEQIINTRAERFFVYHKARTPEYDWEKYSLFNLLAVQQVARNYPQYFPEEVLREPRNWLQNNWMLWADGRGMNCIRYGLLSGFPLGSVLKFAMYKEVRKKLEDGQETALTEEERELMQAKQSALSWTTMLSYFSFYPEDDQRYMQQLDEIYLALKW